MDQCPYHNEGIWAFHCDCILVFVRFLQNDSSFQCFYSPVSAGDGECCFSASSAATKSSAARWAIFLQDENQRSSVVPVIAMGAGATAGLSAFDHLIRTSAAPAAELAGTSA